MSGVLVLAPGVVVLRGSAVVDAARLVNVAVAVRRRRTGREPSGPLLALQQTLTDQAEVVLRAPQHEVVAVVADPDLGGVDVRVAAERIGSKAAAAILGVSISTVQRLAPTLGGRLEAGCWWLDRAAVMALANKRKAAA